jgi:flagellar motor switch protein FliN
LSTTTLDTGGRAADTSAQEAAYGALLDIEIPITLRFGRTRMLLEDLLELNDGSVIEFDGHGDEPIEVLVNGHVVARCEAVMAEGNHAVRISAIASLRERQDTGSDTAT